MGNKQLAAMEEVVEAVEMAAQAYLPADQIINKISNVET